MKIQFIKFLNTYGKSKVIVLAVLMLVVAHTYSTSAATLKLPPTNLGLVGYWPMDESGGSVVKDFSGKGNNGTTAGSPTRVTGKVGNALNFNGSSYVNTGTSTNLVNGFTAVFWINPTAYSPWSVILAKDFWNLSQGWAIFLPDLTGAITYQKPGVGGSTLANAAPLSTWTHIAIVNNNGSVFIYKNGTLAKSGDSVPLSNSTTSLLVGARHSNDGNSYVDYFRGAIDDARVYNRALSANEIQQIYNSSSTSAISSKINTSTTNKNTSGLVGYWTFDGADTTTTTATDKSGSGNNGTLTNGPTMVSGKIGQALKFNGTNNTINIGTTVLNTGASGSVSMWIKPISAAANGGQPWLNTTMLSNDNIYLGIQLLSDYKIRAYYWNTDATPRNIDSVSSVSLNKWYFITYTWNSSGSSIYINGSLDTSSGSLTWANVHTGHTGQTNYIGSTNGASYFYGGAMDDVRIYNRMLSAVEVKQLYNTGVGTQVNSAQVNTPSSSLVTGLVGYWPFNGTDISGTTAYDRSTGAHNGTLTNSPSVVLGKMGQALNFNGSYVNLGHAQDGGTTFTWTAWVKTSSSISQGLYYQAPCIIGLVQGSGFSNDAMLVVNNGKLGWFDELAGSEKHYDVGNIINDNKWHHVVVTRNGVTLSFYVDGVFANTTTTGTNPLNSLGMGVSCSTWTLGYTYVGSIDDARIYNRALSVSEVKQLYLLGK